LKGTLEAVIGPMYAGKTEELIRRVMRRKIAKQNGIIFKITSDTRNSEEMIISRAGTHLEAKLISKADDARMYINDKLDYVAFDEIQFFGSDLVDVVKSFIDVGTDVITSGLNLDFRSEPFDNVMKIVAMADEIALLKAVCVVCGKDATLTQRLIMKDGKWRPASTKDPIFKVEGSDVETKYEPRCKDCWKVGE